jgi:ubiquinone/menaquinone biosynthesis C-methylase UbiE
MRQESESPLGITYVQSDIATIPFLADESIDKALADMVFVTVSTQEVYIKSIAEVSRILKKGGSILISKGHPANFDRNNNSSHYAVNYDAPPSYFASLTPQHISIKIDGKDVKWTNYHRTLEDFVNPWTDAGFVVTKIIEPRPTQEAVVKYPEQLSSTAMIPPYVIFLLRKDN